MGTLIDSSVLLDVATQDPVWFDWSTAALADAVRGGPVLVESDRLRRGCRSATTGSKNSTTPCPADIFRREPLPYSRRVPGRQGVPGLPPARWRSYLPAARLLHRRASQRSASFACLTRDAGRYRTYFPTVEVISP